MSSFSPQSNQVPSAQNHNPPMHKSPPISTTMKKQTLTLIQTIPSLTHILTHPTTTPSLHSQLFVSSQIPPQFHQFDCYPPFLPPRQNPNLLLLRWSLSLFIRRLRPRQIATWRSKCPFQQPPPVILSPMVEPAPAMWGPEERRAYFRKRLGRGRLGFKVPPLAAVVGPSLGIIVGLFLWDPLWK